MKKISLIILLSLSIPLQAQVTEEWVARYNGPANLGDGGVSIAVSSDGFIYVAGITALSGNDLDYILIKYNQSGQELWNRTYDGTGNSLDLAVSVAVDNAGFVYITGSSRSTSAEGSEDITTLKYNPDGDVIWIARYSRSPGSSDVPVTLKLDDSGNVFIAGNTIEPPAQQDVVALKYNSDGVLQWATIFNNSENTYDHAFLMVLDNASNMLMTGWAYLNNTLDFLTIKVDTGGNMLWVNTYNGPTNYDDKSHSVAVDNNDNVYVTGCSQGIGTGIYDYATIKYSPNGTEQWIKRYNGIDNGFDIANTVTVDAQNFVYVSGISDGKGTGRDIVTLKYDPDGNQLWERRYDSEFNSDDAAFVITTDQSGGIYIIGYSYGVGINVDYLTLKYNDSGDFMWAKRYDGPANSFDNAVSIAVHNSDVFVTGISTGISSGLDIATIKYSQTTSINPVSQNIPSHYYLSQNYPNPFNPATRINYSIKDAGVVTISIHDILGRKISILINGYHLPGKYIVNFNAGELAGGVYYYKLSSEKFNQSKRMILIK